MTETQGWKETLQPWLEDKIRNSWVDPRQFKSDEEYSYAMKTAWAIAKAADEIIEFVNKTIDEAIYLTEKERGDHPDKLREEMR